MHCYHIYSWQTAASKLHTWFENTWMATTVIMESTTTPTVKPTEDEIIEIIIVDIIGDEM